MKEEEEGPNRDGETQKSNAGWWDKERRGKGRGREKVGTKRERERERWGRERERKGGGGGGGGGIECSTFKELCVLYIVYIFFPFLSEGAVCLFGLSTF